MAGPSSSAAAAAHHGEACTPTGDGVDQDAVRMPVLDVSPGASYPGRLAEQARSGGNSREVPELTLRELNHATAKFSSSRLIGRGEHAEVFLARLPGGRDAAAKRLISTLPAANAGTGSVGNLRRQVAVASRLRHDNVVSLLGYNFTADQPVLLYELAVNGALHDALHDALHGPRWMQEKTAGIRMPTVKDLTWEERVRIALGAATGLAYLHEAAVAHHNVRSTKVLLFGGIRAKIADHNGFKEVAPPVAEPECHTMIFETPRGSEGYNPPEYFDTGDMTQKSDVYNFGVVLLELLTGRKPYNDTLPRDQQILLSSWAIPLLEHGRVQECIDPKLGDQYPPAGALNTTENPVVAEC